ARDGAGRQRPGRAAVGEEGAALEGVVARLVGHFLLAAGQQQNYESDWKESAHEKGTSSRLAGFSPARNARVCSRSKRGSRASMHRKKRSCVALSKAGTLKSG